MLQRRRSSVDKHLNIEFCSMSGPSRSWVKWKDAFVSTSSEIFSSPFRLEGGEKLPVKTRINKTAKQTILLGKIFEVPGETMNRIHVYGCCVALAAGSMAALVAAPKGDAAKGKEVFSQCAVCHATDTAEKKVGPSLKGLFKHDKLVNGKKVTDATVREKIEEGGNGMPSYKDLLSDQEKDDVIAYLKTL
jgi:cytochrome c